MSMAAEPQLWKYVLAGLLLALVAVPLWSLLVLWGLQPEYLLQESELKLRHVLWLVGLPVALVPLTVSGSWLGASTRAIEQRVQAKQSAAAQKTAHASQQQEQARREYVLEVIGLGVTLDQYRQGALWEVLKQGSPYASIREQDPKKYPWSADDKDGQQGLRSSHSLENGAGPSLKYWGVPTFAAMSPADDPKRPTSATDPVLGVPAGAMSAGMAFHLFVAAGWEQSERPDRVLARVFDFFDEHPDVPYVVLSASDGLYFRDMYRPKGTPPLIRDGYYVPPMPDASMLLVLARRERVDAVRPYVFGDMNYFEASVDDMNRYGYAHRLGLFYGDFKELLPKPEGVLSRPPTAPEWIEAARDFAQRNLHPTGLSLLATKLNPMAAEPPPSDFRPTPWFPIPWTKRQLDEFDQLPTLGFLHRPVFVPTVDEHGQPLKRRDARAAALAAGWQQALQTLPEAKRASAPTRVFVATGGQVEQTTALTSVLSAWAEHGGPEPDLSQPTQWIDTDARLGNTGAATWFMQMAIGAIASYRDGGASAAINLRDPAEASIVFVTPPSPEKIRSQQHIKGGDVFRRHATPAIDPANYQQ